MHAIETTDLRWQFPGGPPVLRGVSLQVPRGSIYGFLGPNGAGKTTSLRLVLGLLTPQQGTVQVLGQRWSDGREALLQRVGSAIESPSLYAHLTARENLLVWQRVFRCPLRRVDDVLALVGLADAANKRSGEFSLGMKQRLGLAMALLHEPEVLVLDEPTNGLDPHGLNDVREVLSRLHRDRGVTILLSSHALAEVEKLVTHVGVLSSGTLVFQGLLRELLAHKRLTIDTADNDAALKVLEANGRTPRRVGQKLVLVGLEPAEVAAVNRELVTAGLAVHELSTGTSELEQHFFSLVDR